MNKGKIAEAIRTRFKSLQSNQQEVFDKVEQYKAMYHCAMEEDEAYPWDYQLTDPQIFPTVRAHLARMNPSEARISLIGEGDTREVNQQLVNWELNEILITQLMYNIMYSGFMSGHGYAKTGWFHKDALKIKADKGEKKMNSIQDRADATFVRFNDLFIPNRNLPNIHAQPYTVEKISMRYGDLLDDQKITERWEDKVLKKIAKNRWFTNQIDYGVDLPQDDGEKEDALMRSQYVSLLCMYTADAEEFWVVEDGDNELLNKETDNIYWHGHYPYLDFVPFPEDDEFFSMGIPHTIADLEIALSSTLNQLLTNGRKAGNQMWLLGNSAKGDPDWMFVDRPNGIIRTTGNIQDYQRMDFNSAGSQELLSLRQTLQTTSEKTSGISSLYSSGVGTSPEVNQTATGAKVIDNNIDQNLQLLISLFGAQILKTMGEHFLELNAQYITEEQVIDITGKNGKYEYVHITPDEVSADFKVKASPERLLKAPPAVKLASLQNTITMLEKQTTVKVDTKPLYEELIRQTPGLEDIDPDAVILDPEKKANEVIKAVLEDYDPPKATIDDDHKLMIGVLQKQMIDEELPDEQVEKLVDYITELKRWIDAKNVNLLNPENVMPQMNPTDPAALGQSMDAQMGVPNQNPTAQLPLEMTQDQLGGVV